VAVAVDMDVVAVVRGSRSTPIGGAWVGTLPARRRARRAHTVAPEAGGATHTLDTTHTLDATTARART
jgi:hypothetical protein